MVAVVNPVMLLTLRASLVAVIVVVSRRCSQNLVVVKMGVTQDVQAAVAGLDTLDRLAAQLVVTATLTRDNLVSSGNNSSSLGIVARRLDNLGTLVATMMVAGLLGSSMADVGVARLEDVVEEGPLQVRLSVTGAERWAISLLDVRKW